jgi:tetratricopeptide (TPR) repeat protein
LPRKTTTRPRKALSIPVPARIKALLREGRFVEAVQLAKQLVETSPTDENRAELRETYLAVVQVLAGRDAKADTARWLDESEKIDGPNSWWEALALQRARLGDGARARKLLEKAAGTTALSRIVGAEVDQAMADRQRGRDLVPADLRPGFELIRQAFAQYDQGQDEAARQTLQGIGLSSPYLDWKLLLRGLIAYSTNDDVRAAENWARLDPERLPAKLALPLRFNSDAAFRNALPPDQAKALARRATAMAHPMLAQLREVQFLLASPEGLSSALRKVSSLVGLMKVSMPQLAPKLANCFYWLIMQHGEPEDLDQYRRLFGPHPEDRRFNRLQALIMENIGDLERANEFWKDYVDEIGADAGRWPGEVGRRARAMIWKKMGENAEAHDDQDDDDEYPDFDDFLDLPPRRRKKSRRTSLEPSAENCYKQALELAPDWKPTALNLINLLRAGERYEEAEAAAVRLLERHPDDVDALVDLSEMQSIQGKLSEATDSLRRAIRNNPLDRGLRARLSSLSLACARSLAQEGDFEGAASAIRETIENEPGLCGNIARAIAVACAFKRGDEAAAERLLGEFSAEPRQRAAIAYIVLVEGLRLKVAKKVTNGQLDRFEQALGEALGVQELALLATFFGHYRSEPKPYRGIGPHEKRISLALQRLLDARLSEAELADFGFMLLRARLGKLLLSCARQGAQRFPDNPCFMYLFGEQAIMQRPKTFSVRQVAVWFRNVLDLTEELSDDRSRQMREVIERRQQEHPRLDDAMRPVFGFEFGRGFPF